MMRSLKTAHWIIFTIAVTLVAFLLWAAWAELDQVTRAQGRVVPFARVQIVQSEEGGAISAIKVREGDRVVQGDVLVELETAQLAAAVEEARVRVAALQSRKARIDAELFNRPLRFPASLTEYSEFTANQRQLYARRRAALQSELASLQEMLALQEEEIALNRPLLETGDVARAEVIRMQRAAVETKGRISTIRSNYISELQSEFAEIEEQLAAAEQQLARDEYSFGAASLEAPADGIVKNVRFTTVGGVLRPGDEVLQIVPTGEKLIIEARVPPRDIAFVQQGQQARVNFDAYDSSIYGWGSGEVVFISPDTLSEEREDGSRETYYRVNLEVETDDMRPRSEDEVIDLQSGMTASVEILTGKSTVWEYITKPILKTSRQSLQER